MYFLLRRIWLMVIVLFQVPQSADAQAAQVIGRAVSRNPDILLSFQQPDPDYDIPGDMFGIRSRKTPDAPDCRACPGLPQAMLDQTASEFDPLPSDDLGLIRSHDFDPFFGVVDTANGTGERLNTASWAFDIGGFTDLVISIDMAAMGDFEAGDIHRGTRDAFAFDYSIDGGPFESLVASSVDTEASLEYQMELPKVGEPLIRIDDPLAMNGVTLNNVFQTLATGVTGVGNQLELRFRAVADGADEVFAFRNILVEAEAGGIAGDFNGNGVVEQGDLDLVLLNWGLGGPPPAEWVNDLPTDAIDQAELDSVLLNWGNRATSGMLQVSVPEPPATATALLLLVLACLAFGYKSSAPVMFVIRARSFRRSTE